MLIVVAVIGLLITLATPNFVKARMITQQNACIYNLRQIDGARQMWALETDAEVTATPVWTNIQPYLNSGGTNRIPICPADMSQTFATSYRMLDLNTVPTCRIDPVEHFLQ
jgi:hypothetical protein